MYFGSASVQFVDFPLAVSFDFFGVSNMNRLMDFDKGKGILQGNADSETSCQFVGTSIALDLLRAPRKQTNL